MPPGHYLPLSFSCALALLFLAPDARGLSFYATDIPGSVGGTAVSQAIVSGNPAVVCRRSVAGGGSGLIFARNSMADGSGTWAISLIDSASTSFPSLAIVNGTPAVSCCDLATGALKFARNAAADGSGAWTVTTVANVGSVAGLSSLATSLCVVDGKPAISYCDNNARDLKFIRSSTADGTGTWTTTIVDEGLPDPGGVNKVGHYPSMKIINGQPAIAYFNYISDWSGDESRLMYARCSTADGAGIWNRMIVDQSMGFSVMEDWTGTGQGASLAVIDGRPAITYGKNASVMFARSNDSNGTGPVAWTKTMIDPFINNVDQFTSLTTFDGKPVLSYIDFDEATFDYRVIVSRNSAADGSGTWSRAVLGQNYDYPPPNMIRPTSLSLLGNGNLALTYSAETSAKWVSISFAPAAAIVVQDDVKYELADGLASKNFGSVALGSSTGRTWTITNMGDQPLSGLTLTMDGAHGGDYVAVSSGMSSPLAPGATTSFSVNFVPTGGGLRTATLHIASNDPEENPFDITLSGTGIPALDSWRQTWFGSTANSGNGADTFDFDKDGLVNLIEFAFGLNPKQGGSRQIPAPQWSGGNLVVSFTQPGGVNGILYGAEWSSTLGAGDWQPVPDTGVPPQHVFVVPVGANARAFVRLKVTPQ